MGLLTSIKEAKISVYHPAVTLWSKRRVPQPGNGLAVGQECNEGKEGVKASKSCYPLVSERWSRDQRAVLYRSKPTVSDCTNSPYSAGVATRQWISSGIQTQTWLRLLSGRIVPRAASGSPIGRWCPGVDRNRFDTRWSTR